MAEDTFTLDVRIEIDEFDLEDLRRALNDAEQAGQTVSRVKMRNVQWKALKRRAGDRYGIPDLQTVFGYDIVIEEDGLTPRQRSVKRIEAELGRTRAQQVADFLRDEDIAPLLFDFANHEFDLADTGTVIRGATTTAARKAAAMTEVLAQFGTLGMSAGEATNALAANLRRMSR